jgi:WD40 repeat protein
MRPREAVRYVGLSRDGERVITAGGENGFRVWHWRTGEVLDVRSRDGGSVTSARFSADGRLVVAENRGGARVWDAESGRARTPPLRHCGALASATLGTDGRVVTVSQRGTVCVWELSPSPEAAVGEAPPDDRPVTALLALARLLACARIDENQERKPLEEGAFREAWSLGAPAILPPSP